MKNPLLHGIQRRDTRFSEHRITCEASHTSNLSCYACECHRDKILPSLVKALGCSHVNRLILVNACLLCYSIALRGAVLIFLSKVVPFLACIDITTLSAETRTSFEAILILASLLGVMLAVSIANAFKIIQTLQYRIRDAWMSMN